MGMLSSQPDSGRQPCNGKHLRILSMRNKRTVVTDTFFFFFSIEVGEGKFVILGD